VAEGADPTVVAIAAPGAAELYDLEVLQENVSQSEANQTRFYVVSQQANELEGYDRAVYVATIGASELPAVLDEACQDGTELVCVHDRPEGSALGTYRYVIELAHEGGFTGEELARIEGIEALTYLGRYGHIEG
jgi:prephenate dehydratase